MVKERLPENEKNIKLLTAYNELRMNDGENESHLVPAAPEDRDGANVADLDDAAISLSKRW